MRWRAWRWASARRSTTSSRSRLGDADTIRADVEGSIATVKHLSWLFIGIGIVAGVALALVCSLAISRPLMRLEATMRRLADGDLDVDVSDKDRKDEIGRMAAVLEIFRRNAAEVRRLEERTRESERSAAEERRALLANVAARFQSQVAGLVGQVLETIAGVAVAAETMSAIAEETRGRVDRVLGDSEVASASIGTVAAATEEMAAASGEIAQRSDQSHHVASDAVIKVEASSQVISSLTEATGKIGKVVDLIGDIAAQTNLLALNATIEAARAGDAGRGFAVVAAEVKSLADQTAKATSEISTQIAQVQDTTRQAAGVMNTIQQTIRSIDMAAAEVAGAIDQQRGAIAEISGSTQRASASAAQVAGTSAGPADHVRRRSGRPPAISAARSARWARAPRRCATKPSISCATCWRREPQMRKPGSVSEHPTNDDRVALIPAVSGKRLVVPESVRGRPVGQLEQQRGPDVVGTVDRADRSSENEAVTV